MTPSGSGQEAYLHGLRKVDSKMVHQQIVPLHNAVFAKTDCLACGACCKGSPPIVTKSDAKRIAKALEIPPKTFIKRYLVEDYDGSLMMNGVPCSFLGDDNRCSIYEHRPKACREYPHTNDPYFSKRPQLNSINTTICPAAEEIVNRLMKSLPL